MLHSILNSLFRRWQVQTLRTKLLVPIAGLMLISLLGSTLAFVSGTALTRNRLLAQQTADDAQRAVETLRSRTEASSTPDTFGF